MTQIKLNFLPRPDKTRATASRYISMTTRANEFVFEVGVVVSITVLYVASWGLENCMVHDPSCV